MSNELRVIELFSGIGSQRKALNNLNKNHKVVAISEWDIPALISYGAIFDSYKDPLYKEWSKKSLSEIKEKLSSKESWNFTNNGKRPLSNLNKISSTSLIKDYKNLPLEKKLLEKEKLEKETALKLLVSSLVNNNLGDISKIDAKDIPDSDLITYSFPCQDLSLQGLQKGLKKGSSSSLLWEVKRILQELNKEDRLPSYLMMENVFAIFGEKHKSYFNEWKRFLKSIGYVNHDFLLTATDFNVPQNRKRAFMVSIKKELNQEFNVPKGQFTKKRIKDIIEKDYDSKYIFDTQKYEIKNLNPDLNKNIIAKTKIDDFTTFTSEASAYSIKGISPTITATGALSRVKIILDDKVVRYYMPVEAWKLMGFTKTDFNKAASTKVVRENQLVKQAGNSIVVNVLEEIFKELFKDGKWN